MVPEVLCRACGAWNELPDRIDEAACVRCGRRLMTTLRPASKGLRPGLRPELELQSLPPPPAVQDAELLRVRLSDVVFWAVIGGITMGAVASLMMALFALSS